MVNLKRGFGVGAVIVIIAIILLLGAYLIYGGNQTPAPEATPENAELPAAVAALDEMPSDLGTTPLPAPTDEANDTATKTEAMAE